MEQQLAKTLLVLVYIFELDLLVKGFVTGDITPMIIDALYLFVYFVLKFQTRGSGSDIFLHNTSIDHLL